MNNYQLLILPAKRYMPHPVRMTIVQPIHTARNENFHVGKQSVRLHTRLVMHGTRAV
jgi:hypothetical protein